MAFISTENFNEVITTRKEEEESTSQWRDLPTGVIFHIDQRKKLKLKEGIFLILELSDKEKNIYRTWAPKRLGDELLQDYSNADVYIRSNGLKTSKTDPSRSYYCYDIVEK